ncbi:MAG: hypothetical protein WCJ19_02865 [bacterium]
MPKIKFIKTFIKILVLFSCVFMLVVQPTSNLTPTVDAQSSSDLTNKLADINKQLDELRAKKQQIDNQLNAENHNQDSYANQISTYEQRIQSLDLAIQEKKKTIEAMETQIQLLQKQMDETQAKITVLEGKLADLKNTYENRVKNNFQNSFRTTLDSMLEIDSFDNYIALKEFASTISQENQLVADELAVSKTELEDTKKQLSENLAQQNTLHDQLKAEATDLDLQQQGIAYQKNQKEAMLNQSKKNSQSLNSQKDELVKTIQKEEKELDDYLFSIMYGAGNGSSRVVHTGDPIGKEGRSGWVANNDWSYPDPDTEPCGGAHLHFEVWKDVNSNGEGGYRTNPLPYIQNGTISQPMKSYYITQYYGENAYIYPSTGGHPGLDLDGGCGTPIYAVGDGLVNYYCSFYQRPGYRRDDYYIARLYIPSKNLKIVYMHLMKAPGVCG